MKVCIDCKKEKSLDFFELRKDTNKYRNQCKNCKTSYHKKWKKDNKDKVDEWDKNYRKLNRERLTKYHKTWRCKNIERINERRKIIYKKNMNKPEFRILNSCRSRIRNIVLKKHKNTLKLIGCSPKFLREWLEWQFNSKMNWENYGSYWHIEHVTPCASFNLLLKNEQYECFNWKNLKPLKASLNSSKGKKILLKDILLQELKVYYYQHNKL